MAYFNLAILLSRAIFAGFSLLFIIVAYSFMQPFTHYALGHSREKNRFLYLCLTFIHLGGIAILAGKTTDVVARVAILRNGLIVFILMSLTLWLLRFWRRDKEIVLWNLVFFLMDMGYLMLERLDHDLATKQIIAYLLGVSFALVLPSLFSLVIRASNRYLYLGILLLTMLLPFIAGDTILGAKNWVNIAGLRFQPSEIGKVALVLYLAALWGGKKKMTFLEILQGSLVVAIALGCLIIQRDLGAALLYYMTFLVLLLLATGKLLLPLLGLGLGGLGGVMGYFLFSHVQVRVEAWQNPWQDITGSGYQVVQGLFAMGTWGWLGSGLTRGTPSVIPFASTDYIFPAICEEFGNFMGIILLLCYLGIILQTLQITRRQHKRFELLVTMGIGALFTLQTFIILGGVLKIIPLTGITTPFMSAGGSSLVVSFGMIGLLTYLSYQSRKQDIEEGEND
ncbi:cell division protein [Sporanaerobium hydrogeniformans]|uniref:Cell division protein n=1 Tax=Sporanaerobium hydrogeniformans TaxID=3072179 RepID=A0AC61DCS4_9FIRM|nr:FtsW/RodA/SpoVE family cell cycle protein [Sporanaerobium hydrogeniformans]PHV71055.1 cell division protein [Sporanaerobium hydrogeniformans]